MHTIYTRDFPGMTTCTWCLCPCTSTTSWGEGQLTTTISIQGKNMDIESALLRNTHTNQELVCLESCNGEIRRLWPEHAAKALSGCIYQNTRRCSNTQKL